MQIAKVTGSKVLMAVLLLLSACNSSNNNKVTSSERGNSVYTGQSAWTKLGTRENLSVANTVITSPANAVWSSYEPAPQYPNIYTSEHSITMADGIELSVTVGVPADEDGNAIEQPFPTILTMTGYNKFNGSFSSFLGAPIPGFITQGYAHAVVDVRGTGASGGQWSAFGEQEQADYWPTIEWVATQPFSNGRIGFYGASLLGITSVLGAAQKHPAVKALFPIVPLGDAYRDIVFSGGQTNAGFIPLWLSLVAGLSVVDPSLMQDPASGTQHAIDRLDNMLTTFHGPMMLNAITGEQNTVYDGEFWRVRSPLEHAENIHVPTFIVGGLLDIFQRGEPLLYEALKNHTTAKLLMGPWQHLGLINSGLPQDGVPEMQQIALRWFDHYVKGEPNGADQLPNVTQYVWGHGHYATSVDWPDPQARAQRWYMRGDSSLTQAMPEADEASHMVVQQPLNGLCSPSTAQWTAGVLGLIPVIPCFSDDTAATALDAKFDTAPMEQDFYFTGPIQADIWIETTAENAGLSVRLSDIAPDGSATPLSNGILTASMRAVDESRSRTLNGEMIQPWHTYKQETVQSVGAGNPIKLNVEIFPTNALIKVGHRLRISVGPSDVPHGVPPLPDLLQSAIGAMTILNDAEHPSSVVLPVVPASVLN